MQAALLLTLLAAGSAFAQPAQIDFSLAISEGGVPVAGGEIVYALVVSADWWTDAKEPFVVRLSVPTGLEPISQCTGEMHFDAAARVLTWSDRLDNPYTAQSSCPLVFRIGAEVAPGTTYTLAATLTTTAADRNPSNNAVTHSATVLPASDLEVTSSVDVRNYRPGATVTYTINVTNLGPQDAYDVILTDEVSPHVSVVSYEQTGGPASTITSVHTLIPQLRAGSTATFRLVVRAKTDFESANIRNRAAVQSAYLDLRESNNVSELWTFAGPQADLTIRGTRSGDAVTLHVTNNGPDAVQDVRVANALFGWWDIEEKVKFASVRPSQGTCSAPELAQVISTPPPPPHWSLDCALGALASGAEATITLVIDRAPDSAPLRLGSAVGPTNNDPRPDSNHFELLFENAPPRRRSVR